LSAHRGNFRRRWGFQAEMALILRSRIHREPLVKNKMFWTGIAAGTAATLGGAWLLGLSGRSGRSRIIRLEKSVQIGRSLQDVFENWCDLESLPRFTSLLRSVRRSGDRSHWVAEVAGRPIEWEAEILQVIPNQSIGWKTVKGAQHTGRVTFAPVGDQTLIHVQMNYAPRPWVLRPLLSPITGQIEGFIEQVLRDVKAALESGKGNFARRVEAFEPTQATGTYGPTSPNPRFGTPTIPVEFTRPPESKS